MNSPLPHHPKWQVFIEMYTHEMATRPHKMRWFTVLAENEHDAAAMAVTRASQMLPGYFEYVPCDVRWMPRVVAGVAA